MSDVVTLVIGVLNIANEIYDAVEAVEYNRAQCENLANSVKIVEENLRALNEVYPDSEDFLAGLESIFRALVDAKVLIQRYKQTHIVIKLLRRKTHEENFLRIYDRVKDGVRLLNLGINIHELVNQEKILAAQEQDRAYLIAIKGDIEHLCEEKLRAEQPTLANDDSAEVQVLSRELFRKQASSAVKQFQSMMDEFLSYHLPEDSSPSAKNDTNYTKINYYDLHFERLLGRGQHGQIWRAQWQEIPVAVKTLESDMIAAHLDELEAEMSTLSLLTHPNIVRFYGGVIDGNHACLVTEYLENASLRDYLSLHSDVTLYEKLKIARNILRGLLFLHGKDQLHNALSSNHVLLSENLTAKLTDFKLATQQLKTLQTVEVSEDVSIRYYAPERFSHGTRADIKQDVYSFGVLLLELMSGELPFHHCSTEAEVIAAIESGEQETIPDSVPEEIASIIRQCCSFEAYDRPELSIVLQQLDAYCDRHPSIIYDYALSLERQEKMELAKKHYELAANKGLGKAYTALGMFSMQGQGGMRQSATEAFRFFSEGEKAGHYRATFNKARLLEKGADGVRRNVDEAERLFTSLLDTEYGAYAQERIDKISRRRQRGTVEYKLG